MFLLLLARSDISEAESTSALSFSWLGLVVGDVVVVGVAVGARATDRVQ